MNLMKIKLVLLICLILLLLGFGSPNLIRAAPQALTYMVNSNTDASDATPGDGVCATSGGNCTLHAAIEKANLDGQASVIKFASRFQ